jgi:protocatechuate 3,4-dioxygenase beta subunit
MNNVFIKADEFTTYISRKYFKNRDLISIDDLICLIEDLDDELELKQQEIDSLTYKNDYPNEESDMEKYYE